MISRHIGHGRNAIGRRRQGEASGSVAGRGPTKNWDAETTTAEHRIEELVAGLGSRDGRMRERSRTTLEMMGEPAIKPLLGALSDSRKTVRWEAAKALRKFKSHQAIAALLDALEDKAFGVRWLASQALAAIGPDVVEPLLRRLVDHMGSQDYRESAHHVLQELRLRQGLKYLKPVLQALDSDEPEGAVPAAVHRVLEAPGTR